MDFFQSRIKNYSAFILNRDKDSNRKVREEMRKDF